MQGKTHHKVQLMSADSQPDGLSSIIGDYIATLSIECAREISTHRRVGEPQERSTNGTGHG